MFRKLFALFFVCILFELVAAPFAYAGFGITPPYVRNTSLTRNSVYEQEILMVRSDPNKPLKALVEVDAPEIADWIEIVGGTTIPLPVNETKVPMVVKITVPDNADFKTYEGAIRIKTVNADDQVAAGAVSISLGAQIDIDLTVIDKEIKDFRVRRIDLPDLNEGHKFGWLYFPGKIRFSMLIENTGNIDVAPSNVSFAIYDPTGSVLLEETTHTNRIKKVKPFATTEVQAEVPTRLPAGSYVARYSIFNDDELKQEGELTLSVLPYGSVQAAGYGFFGLSITHKLSIILPVAAFLLLIILFIYSRRSARRSIAQRMQRGFVIASTLALFLFILAQPTFLNAQFIATTSVQLSKCGDSIVSGSEECDVPGETGSYSTTIAGRQCNNQCEFGPYCGDGTMQTIYGEECDDANNTSGDFCSPTCTIEPSSSGGGGGGGGGSRGSGGATQDLGDTRVQVSGLAYPNETVHVLLDGESVGSVKADKDGAFALSVDTDPGAATLGFWSTDAFGTRSITYSTTFDVTQGAVTDIHGVLLPPTIRVSSTEFNPGDVITISGQAPPNKTVEIYIGNTKIAETGSNSGGDWSLAFDSTSLTPNEYALKARYLTGSSNLKTESSYSTVVSLFVGVDGKAARPSDLNRDGKVNLIDFSILIFWWGTAGGDSNPPADINQNARVGLEDFSILLFNWTG